MRSAELNVEKLVYGGDGLARLEGQAVLVPFVLPSERVSASLTSANPGLLRGTPLQILQPAAQRIVPRCEYFGDCGGCQYQHAEYGFQLEQKQAILRETLRRLGGIDYDREIHVIAGEPWFYRNRIQLHFEERQSGFHRAGSRALCAVERCYISSPVLVDVIAKLQTAVKQPQWPGFLRSLEFFTNESQIQVNVLDSARPVAARFFEWLRAILPNLAPGSIEYDTARHKFQISRGAFFQVNRFLIDALIDEVIGDRSGSQAVDLYAGVGLFTLPLATRFKSVHAVERGGPAFHDLEHNASRVASHIAITRQSAEQFLSSLTEPPDLIIADPPRAGLGKNATRELLRIQPYTLTLVSCDPATLARDLRKLLSAYRIARMTLIDLFPQTYHFETVVHLQRAATEP
ncbi:MAG TPA: class I SAM-dependent RNA methyltransferase [Bryobacteraceae bacterium]|jgi:23S rRNA (uracil1939-C5)-methyltransferase|nr:class I SAM-dependent RNA methyltransferase [Bryobacteraceae bacterium]